MKKNIHLGKLVSNVAQIKSSTTAKICAVVKCNAYGHGIKHCAFILESMVDCYAVASVEEAVNLREYTKKDIIVMGCLEHAKIGLLIKCRLIQSIHNIADLLALNLYCVANDKKVTVEVKLNSGFNRLGLSKSQALSVVKLLDIFDCISLHGVYTHFCDYTDIEFCREQFANFYSTASFFAKYSPVLHCINTKGLTFKDYHLGMIRTGLAMYGCEEIGTQQIMSVTSNILKINTVLKGSHIGYGEYIAKKDCIIATVQGGYGQGMLREVYTHCSVQGVVCPIIGAITMDYFMVDLSPCLVKIDRIDMLKKSTVTITDGILTVQSIAKKASTIPYQLFTSFNAIKDEQIIYQ
ncbi:MAG: alanine racemase [Clostridiales bacterium]|jgi:alanine racemase|nr:alanine racemase [Clostridiales bacterium]